MFCKLHSACFSAHASLRQSARCAQVSDRGLDSRQPLPLQQFDVFMRHVTNQPLFTASWVDKWRKPDPPGGAGRGGIPCPSGLLELAADNNLAVVDTVTNGDCGLDSFWKSAKHVCKNIRNEPWNSSKTKSKQDAMQALRKLAADWIDQNQKSQLWDDFAVEDLIRATCSDGSVHAYLTRMKKQGEWADTAFIHGLACAFNVDVAILQIQSDVTLLGASLIGTDTENCVCMCLETIIISGRPSLLRVKTLPL